MPIIRVAFVLGLRDFGPKMFNWVQEMFNTIKYLYYCSFKVKWKNERAAFTLFGLKKKNKLTVHFYGYQYINWEKISSGFIARKEFFSVSFLPT